jgi:hypothetical protein
MPSKYIGNLLFVVLDYDPSDVPLGEKQAQ